MDEDVLVGEGLGLVGRGHLLAGVLRQGVLLRLRLEAVDGRHRDPLLAELVLDVLVDEVAGVGQQAACGEEDDGEDEAGP